MWGVVYFVFIMSKIINMIGEVEYWNSYNYVQLHWNCIDYEILKYNTNIITRYKWTQTELVIPTGKKNKIFKVDVFIAI